MGVGAQREVLADGEIGVGHCIEQRDAFTLQHVSEQTCKTIARVDRREQKASTEVAGGQNPG